MHLLFFCLSLWRGVCGAVYFTVLFLWACCRSIKQDLLVAFRNAGILIIAIFLGASLFVAWATQSVSTSLILGCAPIWRQFSSASCVHAGLRELTELLYPSEGFGNSKWNEVSTVIFNGRRGWWAWRPPLLLVPLCSERFVILLKSVASYCDCENYGNQAWSIWMTMLSCLNINLTGADRDIMLGENNVCL